MTFDDLFGLPSRPCDVRVAYGKDPNQFGELRLPRGGDGPFAVVALIHGGCWESEYDLSHAAALATAVTDLGVATWSLEYRRLGHAGGGWPGTFLDVAHGIDFLQTLAASQPLDPARLVVMGHSAGGHLALWTAARPRVPSDSEIHTPRPVRVSAVISLAGITDLAAAYEQQVCESSPGRLLAGGPLDVPRRYAHASPSSLLPVGVPQILVHGSEDRIVPVAFSSDHVTRAQSHGDTATLVVVSGAGHFDVIAPGSIAWPAVRDAIIPFIVRRGRPSGRPGQDAFRT